MPKRMMAQDNKFHQGNGDDGKHYWLTPPDMLEDFRERFGFDFDPCPYPKPDDFDGLTCEWGSSNYVNPPFGSIVHEGKKKGLTAWVRKAIEENKKGKRVVMVYPLDKWVLMLLAAGAKVENLGDVKWHAIEDGTPGKGTGRHIACFILEPKTVPQADEKYGCDNIAPADGGASGDLVWGEGDCVCGHDRDMHRTEGKQRFGDWCGRRGCPCEYYRDVRIEGRAS